MRRGLKLMTPHIIGGVQPHSARSQEFIRRPAGRSRVVIADSGTTVELLVFPSGDPIVRGTRFRYRGTVWEITGKRDSGILVAEPSRH
jgi:hypothetical protein